MAFRFQQHPFWGVHSPLSALTGTGLLITASTRTAFALVCAGALLWVYGCTVLVFGAAKPILPKQGRSTARLFLSGFFGGLYLFILSLMSPLLALETGFFILLVPVTCAASSLISRLEPLELREALFQAVMEALALGGAILALALIREPLGFGTLSLPGGSGGIIELFGGGERALFPVRIMSGSAGGLLLLGYGLALFRHVKKTIAGEEERV
jgi:Na+-translocating ferredoxin:NAD+ oxidoreductase RnfE subunit